MKKYIIILIVALVGCISCGSNTNVTKQYKIGDYIFVQDFPGVYFYTCSVDGLTEADKLFDILLKDSWNSSEDYHKSKIFQKYGIVLHPLYVKDSRIMVTIQTEEEYKQFRADIEREKQEEKTRLNSVL